MIWTTQTSSQNYNIKGMSGIKGKKTIRLIFTPIRKNYEKVLMLLSRCNMK